jgi:hypothetical protein
MECIGHEPPTQSVCKHSNKDGADRFQIVTNGTRACSGLANVAFWPIVLKKLVDVADQIFSASWNRFLNWDAGGRMVQRRRDVGRSQLNCEANKSRM